VRVVAARRGADVSAGWAAVRAAVEGEGLYAAGFVSYEAAPAFDAALEGRPDRGFPLLWMGLYREPAVVDLPSATGVSPGTGRWKPELSETEYQAAFSAIHGYIRSGDTYQVNYTLRLRSRRAPDPWRFFLRRAGAGHAPYAAYLDTGDWAIASLSPELFFRMAGERVESRPMKGTATRGLTWEDDRAVAERLAASEKDRAENVMIVDMVRNDLGRIAHAGSVEVEELFAVESYPTVWQMTSHVAARTDAGVGEVFAALFPPASITGAPKRRTMQIIRELETSPRRVYTGAIGYWGPGRRAQFNVAIRTLAVQRASGAGEYGVGGGLVWDSDREAEYRECFAKARVLEEDPPDFELLETMRWTPEEGVSLLEEHVRRLVRTAQYFGFPLDDTALRRELAALGTRAPAAAAQRVRLTVNRSGARTWAFAPLPAAPAAPPRVGVALEPVNSQDRFLYHKTTHRAVYERARAGCPGFDDVILWNERGEVTESTIANVAVERDGALWTPPVRCGLLAGTLRERMLARGELREAVLSVDDLFRCRRVCLLNSVRGQWDVRVERDR
jgi:para-aminobenzoate synthetase/4-amino-4-deoxychorismate lyase